MRRLFSVFSASLLLAVAILPASASAYTVPNLVAVTSPDNLVAVTYADERTPRGLANAGAFASEMQAIGFAGIPNYDPTTLDGSWLVCEMPQYPSGLEAVYGMQGQGVYEATSLCSYMQDQGLFVRWRLS